MKLQCAHIYKKRMHLENAYTYIRRGTAVAHANFIVGKVQHSMIAGLVLCDVKETSLMGYVYAAFEFYLPNFRQIKRFQKLWCRLTQDKVQC